MSHKKTPQSQAPEDKVIEDVFADPAVAVEIVKEIERLQKKA